MLPQKKFIQLLENVASRSSVNFIDLSETGSLTFKSANTSRQKHFGHITNCGFVGKSGYFFALKMGLCDEGLVKNGIAKGVPLFLI